MSNLRTDSRELAERLPVGDVYRSHIERLCHQIDAVEECWHAAERKAKHFQQAVELWNWCADMGCTVQRNSTLGQPDWGCLDVDGELLGLGWSPTDAIEQARIRK